MIDFDEDNTDVATDVANSLGLPMEDVLRGMLEITLDNDFRDDILDALRKLEE